MSLMLSAVPNSHVTAVAWGDVPSWVSATATTLGLIAAGIAAWFVRGQLNVMKEQATRERVEFERQRLELIEGERIRARAQAELIDVLPSQRHADLGVTHSGIFPVLTVVNGSNRPIHHLRCKASPLHTDAPTNELNSYIGRMKQVGDTGLHFVRDASLRSPLPVLRRNEELTFLLEMDATSIPDTRFWIQFEDDAGLWWQLDSDMHLMRITDAERWGTN